MPESDLPPRVRRILTAARQLGGTSRGLWWGERPDLTDALTDLEWVALEAFTWAGDGA